MPVDDAGVWTPPKIRNRDFAVSPVRGRPSLVVDADHDKLSTWLNSAEAALREAEVIAVDIENHSVESTEKAINAVANLRKTLDQFRSVIGNDLTSIKAASARVQTETQVMAKRYHDAAALLTSPEFMKAIENAERMAIALKAISELSETKLSVAVFNGGTTAQT